MATRAELGIDVEAPEARTRATLLSVARPIPAEVLTAEGTNRLIGGVSWLPWPDIAPTREEADCDTVYGKDPRTLPDLLTQPSFLVWDSLQCSTAGLRLELLARMARMSVEDFVSAQFALELESATTSTGLDLTAGPTVVDGTAVNVKVGIAGLEDYLATGSGKPGMRGVIHLTPGLLVLAAGEGVIEFRDGAYRTATGTVVVGDAGHTGQVQPTGGGAPGAGEAWIYATGDVWFAQSEVVGVERADEEDGGAVYIARNQNRPLAERYGLIVFDSNVVGASLVDRAA